MPMENIPKTDYCPFCGKWVTYEVREAMEKTQVRDIQIDVLRHHTYCSECGEEICTAWMWRDLEASQKLYKKRKEESANDEELK